jgi:hypothetical protein
MGWGSRRRGWSPLGLNESRFFYATPSQLQRIKHLTLQYKKIVDSDYGILQVGDHWNFSKGYKKNQTFFWFNFWLTMRVCH